MGKIILVFVVAVTILGSTSQAAGDNAKVKDSSVESLIIGVNSDNFGLRTSAAYMLGELKCEKGVIPLMRMLKSEEREDARIAAALALTKIENPKGIFALKQAIKFDESEWVRRMCGNFYNAFVDQLKVSQIITY
jgi:HEAT repeat protein